MAWFRQVLRSFAELLFPQSCAGCGKPWEWQDTPWCPACSTSLSEAVAFSYCPRCGTAIGPHLENDAGCPQCVKQSWPIAGVARVGPYEGVLRQAIHNYKFHRQQRLDQPLGDLLAAAIAGRPWCEQVQLLVPVPTFWLSRVRYGFCPVSLLTCRVSRQLHIPVLPIVGVRGKRQKQTGLSCAQRLQNVRGLFQPRRGVNVRHLTVCIVDDVSTSGATLREMALALKAAGAAQVFAAVIAKTSLPAHRPIDASTPAIGD